MKLLGTGNTKTLKGQKMGYMTFILHLAPAHKSGYNVCPMATPGCRAACLDTAGRGRFDKTQAARIRKTHLFFTRRAEFMRLLVKDIEAGIRKADREGFVPVFRLNGTSDIRWETVECWKDLQEFDNVMEAFPDVTFYDYTKIPNRRNVPENYHLTFSRADGNEAQVELALSHEMNVAVVFNTGKNDALPETWGCLPVFDGDDSDLRFLDPRGHVVGLRAKGDAKKDASGFVVIT